MKYLPFEKLVYKSKLDRITLLRQLAETIEPAKGLAVGFRNSYEKPYKGEIDGNAFEITRVLGYGNSSQPQITGWVEPWGSGSLVHVKMKLNSLGMAFMFVWLSGMAFATIVTLGAMIVKQVFIPAALTPVGMLLFGYLMVVGGFKYESSTSIADLKKIFDAEIVQG